MFKILVVEDDPELARLFSRVLERAGYYAITAADGREALEAAEKEYMDLVITDVMMPEMDGMELTRRLREENSALPILMITARGDFNSKQDAFFSGVDDYMVKPVDVNEMVLRVGALLRRAKSVSEKRLTFGSTVLEYDNFTVSSEEGTTDLPQKEFMLLYKLLSSPGRIFTRQQIMDDIWGMESETDPHTVDVHINRLRDRFRTNADFDIVTVRGLGYKAVRKK